MQKPIFEVQGVPSGQPIEIPYGPWLLWGQPQVSYVNVRPQPENRGEVHYDAWIRLTRSPFGSSAPIDITNPENFMNGDTGLILPDGYDFALGVGGDHPALELKTDDQRRVKYLHFPRITAPSIEVALNGVEGIVSTVVWMLTATTNAPIFHDAILVRSMDRVQFRAKIMGRTPDAGITVLDDALRQAHLRPFVSQYVEGVRSSSPLYAFLCFFKICFRMNAVRSRLRKLCERQAIDAPSLNGVLPEDPIVHVDANVVGQKYTAVIDRYQELYRNSIAHFGPQDTLEPLVRLEEELAVRTAGIVLRWIAFDQINQVAASMHALVAAGMNMNEVTFA